MASIRKAVCCSYETGKTVKKNGQTYPETRLMVVGSAFVDSETGRISGRFRTTPLSWDGKFVILDPLPKPGEEEVADEVPY